VDTAVAQVVAAAAGDPAVPAITGYVTVDRSCRVTSVRDGARYQRWVRLFTAAGAEGALLDRVAAGLPGEYAAYLSHPATGPVLHAIAGNFVDLTGGILAPGQVRVVADTGCRPQDRPVVERGLDNPPDRGPVETVLTALGVQATRWETHRVTCPAGGAVWTVEADGGADGGQARSPLDALKEASPVLARPEAYAYRSGPVGVAVRTEAGTVTVTATTTCQ
jgi:hypothetical protein